MTYDKLMADIAERVRDWHFSHPNAPTALYLGQAQKAVLMSCVSEYGWHTVEDMRGDVRNQCMGMTIHFTEDADYCALG